MQNVREQLLASTFWSIRRPAMPLTPGHFVIRLNDPSLAFSPDSAADLLRCYGLLRRALTEITLASAAQLYISRNWQPVGDAMGEPVAETSTPSLHAFFIWPESASRPECPTAASVLSLPAHQRAAAEHIGEVDTSLRHWLADTMADRAAPGPAPAVDPPTEAGPRPTAPPGAGIPEGGTGWRNQAFRVAPVRSTLHGASGSALSAGQWTAVPSMPVGSLDQLGTAALVELAHGVEELAWHAGPRHVGISLWATDVWRPDGGAAAGHGARQSIHIFSREHGGDCQLPAFIASGGLELPTASEPAVTGSVGTSPAPSPTVEK